MVKTKLGKVSLTPKGEWNSATAYEQLDLVSYGGSSWVAKKSNTNVAPSESDFWIMIAKSGVTDYNALENKPTIPTKVSELSNDVSYVKSNGTIQYARRLFPSNTENDVEFGTMSLCPWSNGNKFAFLPAENIVVEETTDGGVTWSVKTVSKSAKIRLFYNQGGELIKLPKKDGTNSILCGLRITITAGNFDYPDGTTDANRMNYWSSDYFLSANRYCAVNALYIFNTGYYTSGMNFTCEVSTLKSPTLQSWTRVASSIVNGGSGTSFVDVNGMSAVVFGGYNDQLSNNWFWRFTFFNRKDSSTTGANSVRAIVGAGNNVWLSGNNMMLNNHIYGYDYLQNVTFPANLSASSMSVGNYPVALQKDFSLIETITLSEDTASIERSQKPNGTAYNFREVVIYLKCLNTGTYKYKVFLNDSSEYLCALDTSATYIYYSMAWIKMRGTLVEYLGNVSAGYLGYAQTRSSLPTISIYANNKNTIQKIKLYNSSHPLPSGAIVCIYGIDA